MTTHSEKEETQEGGGVNTMPSFIDRPLPSFSLFFFYFPSIILDFALNFSLSSAVFFFSLQCKSLLYFVILSKSPSDRIAIRPSGTLDMSSGQV